MMELVDVLDSKSSAARRAGSSPATGTNDVGKFRQEICRRFCGFNVIKKVLYFRQILFLELGYEEIDYGRK